MTKKASDVNEILLCDNDTVNLKSIVKLSSCQLLKFFFKKLGFLDKIFSKKKQLFLFPTKFIKISRRIKQGEHRQ